MVRMADGGERPMAMTFPAIIALIQTCWPLLLAIFEAVRGALGQEEILVIPGDVNASVTNAIDAYRSDLLRYSEQR